MSRSMPISPSSAPASTCMGAATWPAWRCRSSRRASGFRAAATVRARRCTERGRQTAGHAAAEPAAQGLWRYLDNLTAAGPAHVTFDLLQPLHHDEGGGHLQGTVDLAGVKLVDKRFQLAFDNMHGQARYSNGGFDAEELSVRHLGQDGRLSLRAGGYVHDSRLAFESKLSATLDAGVLIDRAPEMAGSSPTSPGPRRGPSRSTCPRWRQVLLRRPASCA